MGGIIRGVVLVCSLVGAIGCSSVPKQVDLDPSFWNTKDQSIGVSMGGLPKTTHQRLGAQGLLDVAVNSATAHSLQTHVESIENKDLEKAADEVIERYRALGFDVSRRDTVDLKTILNYTGVNPKDGKYFAVPDFRTLRDNLGVDRLFHVQVLSAGTRRNYYGFIPTSEPWAQVDLDAQLVDLHTNQLLWRRQFEQQVKVEQPWDQPDEKFPNVTAALEKAMLLARRALLEAVSAPLDGRKP